MIGAIAPDFPFRSPHLQTILGSRGRGRWVRRRARSLLSATVREVIGVNDGVRLEAWLSRQPQPSPAVVLIHGWLGHAGSSYVLSAAAALWSAGFSVFRLNLRDHGNTVHLNEEMFHSARIDEVVDAVNALVRTNEGGPVGLAGYSLGGNFALRVARATGLETVAICPAIDPPGAMTRIDTGLAAYRLFFVGKWQRALRDKERAFPGRYRFAGLSRLRTVRDLTETFVRDHTAFPSMADYFAAYTLTGEALAGTRATVVYAEDDPLIPAAGIASLPSSIELVPSPFGGHCSFIEQLSAPTWADRYLTAHFGERLG